MLRMLENYTVIGLSGYAGAGKDLFCKLLSQRMSDLKRFALADELKLDMRDQLLRSHDIDILNCNRDEKELVRHLLVEYGMKKRAETNGLYWTDRLSAKILPLESNVCVTDIRYAYYDNDEDTWLKEKLGGVLVWINQYDVDYEEGSRVYKTAPNEEERAHGPKVIEAADYIVEWQHRPNHHELFTYVDEFLMWLSEQKERRLIAG